MGNMMNVGWLTGRAQNANESGTTGVRSIARREPIRPATWAERASKLDLQKSDLVLAVAGGAAVLLAGCIAALFASGLAGTVATAALCTVVVLTAVVLFRRIDNRTDEMRSQLEATLALYHVLQPVEALPPMKGYAMIPDSALALCSLVRRERPRVVVEAGSGVSTIITGYCLKALGRGRLISLDASAEFAAKTRAEVKRHGLEDFVTVVHAPLEDVVIDGKTHRWHSLSALARIPSIDLLVDDGPPLHLGRMLRYASLPLLAPKMAPHATLFMNFVAAEERTILGRWLAEFPQLEAEMLATRKGNAILRVKGPARAMVAATEREAVLHEAASA